MSVFDIPRFLLDNALHKPVYRVYWSDEPWGRMSEEVSRALSELERDRRFSSDVEFRHVTVMGEASDWVSCSKENYEKMRKRLEPLGVTFSGVDAPAIFDTLPEEDPAERLEVAAGPLLGAIAGDVVGSVYEFHNVKTQDFPLLVDESTFTDDSVMTLAVADGLMSAFDGGEPITSALVRSMQELGRRYPGAGYGGRFERWLASRSPQPYNSWGNGSAMRVSPAAWACDTLETAELIAAETAKVTHNHPEGIRGAQATAACILLSRTGESNEAIAEYVRDRFGYALDFTLEEIRAGYSFDVSCQGSVPQAIEAFLESDGFEDSIRKAVSIGGDSDTIAAITASIAQGRYGIPPGIEAAIRLRLSDDLLEINDRFCERFGV